MKLSKSEYSLILSLYQALSKSCNSICNSDYYSVEFRLLYARLLSELTQCIHDFEKSNFDLL